jgi:acetyl esterase/lipase
MKKLAIIFLSCFFINCFSQQYSKKWTDLNYADDGKNYHLLDIYLPEIRKQTYPVVVLIYGSAWLSNNSKGIDISTIGNALLNAGYAVVTPNHRASSDAIFPAQIHDIKAAIRFIRANCSNYQLDTSFIGITGSSSGGHLSALAGTSRYVKQYTIDTTTMDIEGNVGKYTSFSSEVDAVCDWFGPTKFLKMDSCGSALVHNANDSPESKLIGGAIQNNKSKCALANPITYVDSTDPPFLIMHGDADPLVPYCESDLLYKALQTAKVDSKYVLVPNAQHGPGLLVDKYFTMMVDFFNRVSNNYTSTLIKMLFDNSIKVYTNPANNTINIQGISDKTFMKYELLEISGKVISENNIKSNQIDIASLNKGIYFIRIHLKDGKTFTSKFIKI